MGTVTAALVGALIAIVGGIIFRRVEAAEVRRHWFRDQLRLAAEQFLGHAYQHLAISRDRLRGDIPDASEPSTRLFEALAIDIARLQLVAPQSVYQDADKVTAKLAEAVKAAQKVESAGDNDETKTALAASVEAFGEMRDFAEEVKRHLT